MLESVTAIGIDLGTTKSCVGIWRGDRVEIFDNDHGNKTMPSCVSFTNYERMIGESAKSQLTKNPSNTIFDVKRLIGRPFSDKSVQTHVQQWPFKVTEDSGNVKLQVEFKGEEKVYAPEEITAMILTKMKEIAEKNLKFPVKDVVISAPAYFNDSQRQATKDAGTIAGLNVLRIINEPTAAAIAYGIYKQLKGERNILIFDLGGGTFDVSVIRVKDGTIFEVKSTVGDTHLGGEDFDYRILIYLVKEFKRKFKKNVAKNPSSLSRLYMAAELAKNALSSCSKACLEIDSLFEGIDFYISITRTHFEKLCEDLFVKIMLLVEKVLKNAQMDKSSINDIVLIGGCTRIPIIQTLLTKFFGDKPLFFSINPDEAVAYGAAIQAAILSGVKSLPLKDIQLVEITPLSLGIETSGNVMTRMIGRNSRIPCKQSQVFSTYQDNQMTVTIQIFEGERPMSYDNNILGTFHLTGIPPAPRGIPKIEVTFDMNDNGILNVTAKENSTGKTQNIIIQNNKGRLSVQEIDKMLEEAEKYKREDEQQRKRIYARNQLEGYIFNIKQTIQEEGDKLSGRDKNIINTKCDICLKWLDNNININTEDLDYQLRDLQLDCSQILTKYSVIEELSANSSNKNE